MGIGLALAEAWAKGGGGVAPFKPSDLSGLVLWLEADTGVTGSSPVTKWADQSSGGNDATPASTGPVLSAGGGPNGHAAIVFDGTVNTVLQSTTANFGDPRTGQTIFLVNKSVSTSTSACPALFSNPVSPNGGYAAVVDVFTNGERDMLVVNNAYVPDANGSATTNWEAWTIVGNATGNGQTLRVNGAQRVTGSVTVSANNNGYRVGGYAGALFWPGSLWGVLVYSRTLSGLEIAQVEGYIQAKTAIW